METTLEKVNQVLHNKGVPYQSRIQVIKSVLRDEDARCDLLDKHTINEIREMLQTVNASNEDLVQHVFMMFGEKVLKVSLDQYYTPSTIGLFIRDALADDQDRCVLEPACGTGDLAMHVNAREIVFKDISKEACELLEMNLSLRKKTFTYKVINCNSLIDNDEQLYSVVIINPPFGTKTIENNPDVLSRYVLSRSKNKQQLGKLFIEYGLRKLMPKGILFIVLPTGYLTNGTDVDLREFIIKRYRILGVLELPQNTFKRSGTGVDTCILIVQNDTSIEDYEIFVQELSKIGIDTRSKNTPPLYKTLEDGRKSEVLDNDFDDILPQLAYFAYKNNIQGLKQSETPIPYNYTTRNTVISNGLSLGVKRYSKEYMIIVEKVKRGKHFFLKDVIARESIQKSPKLKNNTYAYLDISEIGFGSYNCGRLMLGSNLPGRATYKVAENDILVSKLKGKPSFCMIESDCANLIVTNGVFVIRIENEEKRLNFYRYLFSPEFVVQFNSLANGSIMADVKIEDMLNTLVVPECSATDIDDAMTLIHSYKTYHVIKRRFKSDVVGV